ncbi:hypothetical protein B0H67DRAFT_327396 [Lasiosphaeris hirsuta]|uniref:Uncharacterized protein n=1 Tax=Lasiosphaeris hirsuta TaxID=260670 RepID=A0AA40A2V3_9PEZI|nr:hypothetical protein B0H67DRAFT_327396 [Lasiosphaeris hirsuta]
MADGRWRRDSSKGRSGEATTMRDAREDEEGRGTTEPQNRECRAPGERGAEVQNAEAGKRGKEGLLGNRKNGGGQKRRKRRNARPRPAWAWPGGAARASASRDKLSGSCSFACLSPCHTKPTKRRHVLTARCALQVAILHRASTETATAAAAASLRYAGVPSCLYRLYWACAGDRMETADDAGCADVLEARPPDQTRKFWGTRAEGCLFLHNSASVKRGLGLLGWAVACKREEGRWEELSPMSEGLQRPKKSLYFTMTAPFYYVHSAACPARCLPSEVRRGGHRAFGSGAPGSGEAAAHTLLPFVSSALEKQHPWRFQ